MTKQQLPDLAADPVFEADLGQVVGPLSTPLEWQVYVASKVEPAYTRPFGEARPQMEADLKTQIANDRIYELKNKVEDTLAGGATLAEIAKEHHFRIQAIEAVSQEGKDADGKSVVPDAGKAQILEQVFSLPQGSDSPVIDTKEGVSYVSITDICRAPARRWPSCRAPTWARSD